jgi:DNA polymerase (family 10)
MAKEKGILLAISTDTHTIQHFNFMTYGISIARRGWLEKENILNTLNYDTLMNVLKKNKR